MFRVIVRQKIKYNEEVEFWFEDIAKAGAFAQGLINHLPLEGTTKIVIESDYFNYIGEENGDGED